MKAVKLDKANSLTHTILIEMQITRKQTPDQSKSSDSTLILNKHGVRVYPAETLLKQPTENNHIRRGNTLFFFFFCGNLFKCVIFKPDWQEIYR